MRMRNKKNADKRLEECCAFMINTEILKNKDAKELFDNQKPVHLEIGCGKGNFVFQMAQKYPEINFIAVETNKNVLVLAVEKAKAGNISNVKFILGDANCLDQYFCNGSFEKIYLNFSDPWHKSRHEKRRLTYKTFLAMYKNLLIHDGTVQFKTDNLKLFDYSVISFGENGYKLLNVTYDLHADNDENNVMTEYEQLFSSQGHKICRLIAVPERV
ncbi:MAG: tRNA (guanosine(46)-N7)-methyltransferase TrmB [Clostridia bacterium]|nr:tRNA (guanosine(46)-N7)-methyltransferase TrmB [Clostridia bacterium]